MYRSFGSFDETKRNIIYYTAGYPEAAYLLYVLMANRNWVIV